MNTWENTFTVRGLFRTKSVLDMADYVAVWLADKQVWQILKHRDYPGGKFLAHHDHHKELLEMAGSPIILETDYLARDEEGYVEW